MLFYFRVPNKEKEKVHMKHFSMALVVLLAVCCLFTASAEESLTSYQDEVYSFRYPSSWKQGIARDGSIILEIPGTQDGVLTFAIVTDLIHFTGNAEADAPGIQNMLTQYGGKNLSFTGEYELTRYGTLQGFRAPGKWAGKQDVRMVCATDGGHMVAFVLIGERAMAEEESLLGSVVTFGGKEAVAPSGYKSWQGAGFAVSYPESYGAMEQATGTVFMDAEKKDQIIMVRTYSLDMDYTDALAPSIASDRLPKSTKVKAKPEMEQVGGWNAAVIRGDTDSGPLAFYVVGRGRTALALLFIGDDALGYAADVVASVAFE